MSGVRKALEAAAMEQCCDNWDEMDADDRAVAMSFTAPAIAAFLRALPDYSVMQGLKQPPPPGGTLAHSSLHFIAAAVEAAAREGA